MKRTKNTASLIVMQGAPSSGKSTIARRMALEAPDEMVIINRDDIRDMLGQYWVPNRETLVSNIETAAVDAALLAGYVTIVDATNLNKRVIRMWNELATDHKVDINFIMCKLSLRKALWRNWLRQLKGGRKISSKVVRGFYKRYNL